LFRHWGAVLRGVILLLCRRWILPQDDSVVLCLGRISATFLTNF
jgi:hypothetical protein